MRNKACLRSDVAAPEKVSLYFTSESNSFGVVALQWFDGQVTPYTLKRGMYHSITIPQVRAFEYVESRCSDESFYQCLSDRLQKVTSCHGPPCSKYTLPTDMPLQYLPKCNSTDESTECYSMALTKIFQEVFS